MLLLMCISNVSVSVGHDRRGRTRFTIVRSEPETRRYKSFHHVQFLVVVIMIAVVTLSSVPYQSAVCLPAVVI